MMTLNGYEFLQVEVYQSGTMFGYVSAVLKCRADRSTVCRNFCKIGCLLNTDYEELAFKHPILKSRMMHLIEQHLDCNPIADFLF